MKRPTTKSKPTTRVFVYHLPSNPDAVGTRRIYEPVAKSRLNKRKLARVIAEVSGKA